MSEVTTNAVLNETEVAIANLTAVRNEVSKLKLDTPMVSNATGHIDSAINKLREALKYVK